MPLKISLCDRFSFLNYSRDQSPNTEETYNLIPLSFFLLLFPLLSVLPSPPGALISSQPAFSLGPFVSVPPRSPQCPGAQSTCSCLMPGFVSRYFRGVCPMLIPHRPPKFPIPSPAQWPTGCFMLEQQGDSLWDPLLHKCTHSVARASSFLPSVKW